MSHILTQSLCRKQLHEYFLPHWCVQNTGPWYSVQDSCRLERIIKQRMSVVKIAVAYHIWLSSLLGNTGKLSRLTNYSQWQVPAKRLWVEVSYDTAGHRELKIRKSSLFLSCLYMANPDLHFEMAIPQDDKAGPWQLYGELLPPFCPHSKCCLSERWNFSVLNHWDF